MRSAAVMRSGVGAEPAAGSVALSSSARTQAVRAVSRYSLGVPGYRLQGSQALLGLPVPDATQWDQIEVVGDCA